jgi:5'-3' exonuclease
MSNTANDTIETQGSEVPATPLPSSVALVDLSYLFRYEWHGNDRPDKETNEGPRKLMQRLEALRLTVDHVILCQDAPPYWRKKDYPEYKGTRPPVSDSLKEALRWVKERVEIEGYQVARCETFEADDVIATLAKAYEAMGIKDIRLVGCDKDLFQLVRGPVRAFIPGVGDPEHGGRAPEVLDGGGVHKKLGVAPVQVVDYLCMVGDDGDNIKGADGIGPKRAAQVLADWGTLQMAVNAAKREEKVVVPSVTKALKEHGDRMLNESRKLIKLVDDVPLFAESLLVKLPRKTRPENAAELPEEPTSPEDIGELISGPAVNPTPPKTEPPPKPEVTDRRGPEVASAAPESKTELVRERRPAEPTTMLAKSANDGLAQRYGVVDENLQPRDLVSARTMANWFAANPRYDKFGGVNAVFTVIVRAVELGIHVVAALDSFHLVQDFESGGVKLVAPATLIQHLVQRAADCEYIDLIETTSERATYEVKRRSRPKPVRMTYTIEQAKEAELYRPTRKGNKSTWMKHPDDMLRKTCVVKLLRAVFPGETLGLYCTEEMYADVADTREAA